MTVTRTDTDLERLVLTMEAEFAAPPERVWQLWADPRLLERWWGPPTFPATFTVHEFTVGGRAAFHMTGPDGSEHHGWWTITAIDPPRGLEFEDGFADGSGAPDPSLPTTRVAVSITAHGGGSRMVMTSHYATVAQMEQVIAMGVEEGMRQAIGQMDALLID